MPRKQGTVLTDLELKVMNVLWDRGDATAREVLDALAPERTFAYTTLSTILTILGRKGFVFYRKEGKTYRYIPDITREEMTNRAVDELTRKFFRGSREALLKHLGSSAETVFQETAPVKEVTQKLQKPTPSSSVDDIPDWF